MSERPLSRLLSRLRRPRVWLPLLLLAVVSALAGPHLWAAYSCRAARRSLERHRPREALARARSCLRLWPRDARAHLLAGRAARLSGEYDAARHHLAEYRRLEGRSSEAGVLEWALLRAETGDLEEVEDFLRERAAHDPAQAAPVLGALAAGYLRLHRFHEAMGCLEECLRRDPDDTHALFLRGRAWEQVHAYPKAAQDYQAVVERDPEHDEARLRLANARLENGEPAEAVGHLELLRRRRPDDPEVLVRLAFAWNALGRLDDSLRLIDEVLDSHPDLPAALSARGQLAFLAERPAEAERWLRRAVAANPFDRQAHYVLLQSLEQQGKKARAKAQQARLKEVEDTISRLLAITNRLMPQSPRDPKLHHELGALFLKMGREELAVRWFHSALNHDPNYAPAHESLARYYERAGDHALAEYHRRQAAAGKPKPGG